MTHPYKLTFIFGAPRSGTTLLERMLASHSLVKGGPEPHLLTPLAHLGYWQRVDKAPYDHIISSLGQQEFVAHLPEKEQDYWRACRAYCDVLYSAFMAGSPATICIDKTPEYATIWPFITKLFPEAKYVVLTRHPGAIFSSFADSFFGGDYQAAHAHDAILERYIPALASLLSEDSIETFHLKYEGLVNDPEHWMRQLCEYLEISFEKGMMEYNTQGSDQQTAQVGLGDPIGVARHSKPVNDNIHCWASDAATDPLKLQMLQSMIDSVDDKDLEKIGYPVSSLWAPLEQAGLSGTTRKKSMLNIYQLKRKLIVKGRAFVRRSNRAKALLAWIRMACDVLLRES